jgi:hypothetical protein
LIPCRSHAENQFLKDLLETAVPGFVLPSRKAIRRLFLEKFAETKRWLKAALEGRPVSLSFDVWSRPSLSESYLGVCIRVALGGQISTFLLSLHPIRCPHTAHKIQESLDEVCRDWGLKETEIMGFACDSAATNVRALYERVQQDDYPAEEIRAMADALQTDEGDQQLLDGGWDFGDFEEHLSQFPERQSTAIPIPNRILPKRLPCNAHMIANCYSHAMRKDLAAQALMSSVLRFVSTIRKSSNLVQLIKDQCGKALVALSKTRWLSAFLVLTRLTSLKEKLENVRIAVGRREDEELNINWDEINQLLLLLKPGYDAVTALEGRLYPASSMVIPTIVSLRDLASSYSTNCRYPFQEFAKELLNQILTRWANYLPSGVSESVRNPVWLVAGLFDPYNAAYYQKAGLMDAALPELKRWMLREEKQMRQPDNTEVEELDLESSEEHLSLPWMSESPLPSPTATLVPAARAPSPVYLQLQQYLDFLRNGGPLPYSPAFKTRALTWWLSHPKLALLRPLAIRALTLGATSADCESAFSKAAFLLGGNKRRSNSDTLDSRCFLSFNWKALADAM